MENSDLEKFIEYLRMDRPTFNELLNLIKPQIKKQHAVREPIPTSTRLQICLRYLASGDTMPSISFAFRVGLSTVSTIINETCVAIWDVLSNQVFPEITENFWKEKAEEFETLWNFPHCIGAIDGKHIELQAPPHSGSSFYNYKGTHSIVLLALADANCRFTIVDIGAEGRRSDGGIFQESELGYRLENNDLNLPEPKSLIENGPKLPFVIVGDEAFALTSYMLRPYPRASDLNLEKKVFNYRLSRARRIIECSFGILSARWRIFRRPLAVTVENAISIVKATVCLHNFLMTKDLDAPLEQRQYANINLENTNNFDQISGFNINNNVLLQGGQIRNAFTEYFCTEGAVEQQWDKAYNNDF